MRLIWNTPPALFLSRAATPFAGAGRFAAMAASRRALSSLTAGASSSPRSCRLAWTYAQRSGSLADDGAEGVGGALGVDGSGGGNGTEDAALDASAMIDASTFGLIACDGACNAVFA